MAVCVYKDAVRRKSGNCLTLLSPVMTPAIERKLLTAVSAQLIVSVVKVQETNFFFWAKDLSRIVKEMQDCYEKCCIQQDEGSFY